MSKFLSVTLLAGASAIAALVPIQAKALPLALWGDGSRVFVNTVGSQNVDYGGFTFGTISAGGADGNASVVSAPAPVPSIIATAQYSNFFAVTLSAFAGGDFYYYGEVSAPGGIVVPVNLNVTANGSLYSESGSFSTSVSHDTLKVNTATIVDADSTNGINNGDFTISTTISGSVILTNQPYLIHMTATAAVYGLGTAVTFLDPYFSLDPSLVALGYSILTSPDIGNSLAAATPLPAALPLFATGLGVIGLLARRRKRKVVLAAA